jgi:hypothetical protein
MKLPKFLLALPILGLILSSYAVHPYAEQLEASKSQPFIRRALDQDRAAKEEAVRNMNSLSAFIKSKAEETKLETRADLFGRIKTRLEGERKYLGVVDTILEPLSGGITTTWSLETHKMGLALKDLLESYLTEDNLAKVVGGTHLFDTTLTEDSFPAVLNTGFWGTTQAPRYALFLLSVAAELMLLGKRL